MFAEIIHGLKDGLLPDQDMLGRRFRAALTKKMGVIKQPYHLWSNDPKINPSVKHLLWAAVLLEDRDLFSQVESIAVFEAAESAAGNRCGKRS